MTRAGRWVGCALVIAACGEDGPAVASGGSSTEPTASASDPTATTSNGDDADDGGDATAATTSAATSGSADDTGPGIKLDVGNKTEGGGSEETGPPEEVCHVTDDMNAVGDCKITAPPDSFEPAVQWSFAGMGAENQAIASPLVANTNDDNGDGSIDLCDIPEVIVPIYGAGPQQSDGHIWLLDGETGDVVLQLPEMIDGYANPAIGDIDGDGMIELVTIRSELDNVINGHAIALEMDGTVMWENTDVFDAWQVAVALADLDADGDVEIMAGELVLDHTGSTLWQGPDNGAIDIPVAADLDGDGDLEVLLGPNAYHHDGSEYYTSPGGISHPQVANLDDDPEPEVLLAGFNGLTLLEHDGTVVYSNEIPNGDSSWWRPAAIHDIDGDDDPEILVSSNQHYNVYEPDLSSVWTANVQDNSGYAAGTAFDFLGAGYAEAMYADETSLYIYGEDAEVLLTSPRSSWTLAENPVVAYVDNDGSAEIVVVSNGGAQPPVQVIRDVEDRWIQARRIWNQHAYHVTNVREDGTIPQHQVPSWQTLNTFRTNAQIEGGEICKPEPRG
jgi:hypothetical protein